MRRNNQKRRMRFRYPQKRHLNEKRRHSGTEPLACSQRSVCVCSTQCLSHKFPQKRALAEKAQRKLLLASINEAKPLRKATALTMSVQEEKREAKLQLLAEKLKTKGLAGQKLGKHKVPESDVVVQLGEDLSESLRGLKVCNHCHPIPSYNSSIIRRRKATCSATDFRVYNKELASNPGYLLCTFSSCYLLATIFHIFF